MPNSNLMQSIKLLKKSPRKASESSQGKGNDLIFTYGYGNSPFGLCFLVMRNEEVYRLAFFDNENEYHLFTKNLSLELKKEAYIEDRDYIILILKEIFSSKNNKPSIKLWMSGSLFQIKVWQALMSIPPSTLVTYGEIAKLIGQPTAIRATASAIARNNIAYLIPCHRVIRSNGDLGEYRWNKKRKATMITWELGNPDKIPM